MKVLAVTCYTGGEDLCAMTDTMLKGLRETADCRVAVTAQGAERPPVVTCRDTVYLAPKNVGFAYGINRAIEAGSSWGIPDYVLVLNNDLLFPQKDWFARLMKAAGPNYITCPGTDRTALRVQPGPVALAPVDVEELSAYCWLVPFGMCEFLKKEYGFWLFSEDFVPAYGEDNWTAYLLTKKLGRRVFKLVRRSFVKHLSKRTSSVVPHDRKKTSRVLAKKLRAELKDEHLRPDLVAWVNRYLKVLRC